MNRSDGDKPRDSGVFRAQTDISRLSTQASSLSALTGMSGCADPNEGRKFGWNGAFMLPTRLKTGKIRKAGHGSCWKGAGERGNRRTGVGWRHIRVRGAKQFCSPLGASQHYSTNRSDREFYLSPPPICAAGLKFSPRKVFWIINAAILIQLPHRRVGADGGGSLSGVPSPSSPFVKWVHPEYTCCNRDIPKKLWRVNYPNDLKTVSPFLTASFCRRCPRLGLFWLWKRNELKKFGSANVRQIGVSVFWGTIWQH